MSLKKILLMGCVIFGAAGTVHSQSNLPEGMAAPADLLGNRPGVRSRKDAEAMALRGLDPGEPLPSPSMRDGSSNAPAPESFPVGPWQISRPKPLPVDAPAADKADRIDTSALHYYAQQNDLARVSTEIRRIRSHHPDWQPPDDLFSDAATRVDEQPLWALFGKGDLDGLRDAVAALQRDKPDWQPSEDLQSKIKEADARMAVVKASDAGQWQTVIDIATDNRPMLTCANVDVLWRTAEALTHVDDEEHAIEAYKYILATCRNPQERLATVQKAGLLLKTPGALDALIAAGRRRPDGRSEFEAVRLDLLRRKVGAASAGGGVEMPTASDLDTLGMSFDRGHDPADAEVLGWYYYAQKNYAASETWFRKALSVGDKPKPAEGLALTLREQGRLPEAEKLALAHAPSDPANRKLFIEFVSASLFDKATNPDPDTMADYGKYVEAAQSADGAQAYGWHLYNAGDTAQAADWFRKSNTWQPSEQAVIGLMVSAKRLKQNRSYDDLVARYAKTYPKVATLAEAMRFHGGGNKWRTRLVRAEPRSRLRVAEGGGHRKMIRVRTRSGSGGGSGWDSGADSIVKVYQSGNYDQALAMLNARQQRRGEPGGLTVIRGWAQYHKGDWDGAQRTFAALQNTQQSSQAQDGLRVVDEGYHPRLYH